ncbi:MAG: type II secretion system F family protein [Verrucomicrobiota bacterium]|jgi:type II secretory pathway component PulF
MARFTYSAKDQAGLARRGDIDAPSRRDAMRMLSSRGLQVSTITESVADNAKDKQPKKQTGKSTPTSTKPGFFDLKFSSSSDSTPRSNERLPFLESLFDLTSSGLSAGEAVRLLSLRIKEPRLKELCNGLWNRISEGAPLSRAMGDFPAVFDEATLNLIQAGEATGSLNDTVSRIIAHLTEQKELRRQLLTALAYPVFMVFVAFGVILFFLFFLLPRLQSLLDSLGGSMPVSTKILIGFSTFALHYGVFIILAGILFMASFWKWRATDAGRVATDGWMLNIPLIGPFSVSQTVLSFSQTLYVLLENGITASEALKMTERQISNRVHRAKFKEATARVLEGEALSMAIGRTKCFPDLVLDRLAVGENTGNIVPSLREIAKAYQKIISNQLSMFTSVIASAVLMGVFVFVGFIAFAIVSAVFQVSASFKM